MDSECHVEVEKPTETGERFRLCSKTNVALMVFTLFMVGTAAAVLLLNQHKKGPEQKDGHFEELRHTLRQTQVRAAIHLGGKYIKSLGTVQWQKDVDQSYFQGGLDLDNNEIVVPHTGPYFVYSQASYRVSCSSDPDHADSSSNHMVHLSHMVERWSASIGDQEELEYIPILHSVQTACEKQPHREGRWFSGVYVGAMFNLMKGDRLRTTMDPHMLPHLEDENGQTFFGVFAL